MRYGSVCSGIEAATAAWHPLGWAPSFFSEIDAFPRAVLQHHYPDVPLHNDFTTIQDNDYEQIDLLVGGTPCQSFSVAGLRKGLDDDRGNLALEYLRLAERLRPKWLVWENVPGVLSSNRGRDFGSFLGALGQIGYGFAYRVLDAQYFGVAQRRRRVFVVGYLGDWRRAAAVLFERDSLSGNPAPSREAREDVAKCLTTRTGSAFDSETETFPVEFSSNANTDAIFAAWRNLRPTTQAGGPMGMVAFDTTQVTSTHNGSNPKPGDPCHTLAAAANPPAIASPMAVRRLTPVECERLQGFPDDFTRIPYRKKPADQCPDGPRYKALGNSMAVPVMRWIGERISYVDRISGSLKVNTTVDDLVQELTHE